MKQVVLIGEILLNPVKGIYLQTIWYSDGTMETREIPKGPILIIPPLDIWGYMI